MRGAMPNGGLTFGERRGGAVEPVYSCAVSRALAFAASLVTVAIAVVMAAGLWRIGAEVRDLEMGALAGELQLALSSAASAYPVDFARLGVLGDHLAAGRSDDLAARLRAALPDYSGLVRRVGGALRERHPHLDVEANVRVTRVTVLGAGEIGGGVPLTIAGSAMLSGGAVTATHALFLDANGMAVEVVFAAVCRNADEVLAPRLRPLRVGTAVLLLLLATSSAVTVRAIVYGRTVGAFQRDLIDTLAHELHTPLTTLHVGLRTLAGEVGEAEHEVVERLQRQVRRLRRLTERVTVASRSLLHDAVPDLTLLRPDEEISRLLAERFPEPLGADTLGMRLDAPGATVLADRADLDVLVGNLVENAVKFSHAPGASRPAAQRVLVTTSVRGRRLVMTVEDNGTGIADMLARRPGRPFRHGGGAASGLGLGLYLCRRIARRLRGRLRVRRSGLGGACIEVTLPRYRRDAG